MEIRSTKRFPVIRSERITLREVVKSDAEFVHYMRSDPQVNEFSVRTPSATLDDAAFFIEQRTLDYFYKRSIYWGIELNTNGFMIGTITLWNLDLEERVGELSFDLHPSFRGNGYMTEAVKKVLEFGFTMLQLHKIVALTSPKNLPSLKVLEKFHFTKMDEEDLPELDRDAGLYGYQLLASSL